MPSIIERHKQAVADGRGAHRSEVDRLQEELDALWGTLVSNNVLAPTDRPTRPERGRRTSR